MATEIKIIPGLMDDDDTIGWGSLSLNPTPENSEHDMVGTPDPGGKKPGPVLSPA